MVPVMVPGGPSRHVTSAEREPAAEHANTLPPQTRMLRWSHRSQLGADSFLAMNVKRLVVVSPPHKHLFLHVSAGTLARRAS